MGELIEAHTVLAVLFNKAVSTLCHHTVQNKKLLYKLSLSLSLSLFIAEHLWGLWCPSLYALWLNGASKAYGSIIGMGRHPTTCANFDSLAHPNSPTIGIRLGGLSVPLHSGQTMADGAKVAIERYYEVIGCFRLA